jgi:hypothetical protein
MKYAIVRYGEVIALFECSECRDQCLEFLRKRLPVIVFEKGEVKEVMVE